jgi:FMN reductase
MTTPHDRAVGPFVALVGNPRPGSRTERLARAVLDALAHRLDPELRTQRVVVDLATLGEELGPPLGPDSRTRWAGPIDTVTRARVLVVATPTYKGSYTGLLKAFLDHVGAGELRGVLAVPVTTVGSPAHTLAADVHLRPLLVELGASTPTSALVVGEDDLAAPGGAVSRWLDANASVLPQSALAVRA